MNNKFEKFYKEVIILISLFFSLPSVLICLLARERYKFAMIFFLGIAACLFLAMCCMQITSIIRNKILKIDKEILYVSLIQMLGIILTMVFHKDTKYLDTLFISVFSLLVYFVISDIGKYSFVKLLLKFSYVLSIGAVIAFFCVPIGLLPVISQFPNPDGRIAHWYLFSFSNINMPLLNGYFIRPSSIFDEPGQFALFLTFMLLINHYYNNDCKNKKKYEFMFIFAGICTTSLAFYITFFFFMIFIKKNMKFSITVIISVVVLFCIVYSLKDSSQMFSRLYQMSFERIIDQIFNGNISKSSNRTNATEKALQVLKEYPLFGIGFSKSREMNIYLADNFYSPYAQDGIVFGLLIQFPCLYLIFKCCFLDKKRIGIALLLGLNLLQRSFVSYILFLVMLYIMISPMETCLDKMRCADE